MDLPRVLVANEPSAYREALTATLRELRPRLLIHPVEPAELDLLVTTMRPTLVVCSRLSPAVQTHAGAWLLLYPEGEDRAVLGAGAQGQSLPSTAFDVVVAALDAVLDDPTSESPRPVDRSPSEDDEHRG